MNERVDYLHKLDADLITQFRHQPKTQVLISALAKQMQDLYEVYTQLLEKRRLQNAEGQQLDGIGDIVVMTRSEAAKFEANQSNTMDDETYRKYLYYKIFLNTSMCTRREIIKSLHYFWDKTPLYYAEDPDHPATIFVDTPMLSPDTPFDALLETPIVKPAGVRFVLRVHAETQNDTYAIRASVAVGTKTRTQVPAYAAHGGD